MSGGRAPRKNVAYNKPHEPAFLKAFKAKVGYKEPATVDSKRVGIKVPCDDGNDEREDREDELPTVVVLRHGDVGQEEFLDYRQKTKDQAKDKNESLRDPSDTKDSEGGRIMFKKPAKRKGSDSVSVLDATTSKKSKHSSHTHSSTFSRSSQKSKKVKNKSLLSFGDSEEDQS